MHVTSMKRGVKFMQAEMILIVMFTVSGILIPIAVSGLIKLRKKMWRKAHPINIEEYISRAIREGRSVPHDPSPEAFRAENERLCRKNDHR